VSTLETADWPQSVPEPERELDEAGATYEGAAADAEALAANLELLRKRVQSLVEYRSVGDPSAGDPLRGLHHTPETIGWLLGRPPLHADVGDPIPAGVEVASDEEYATQPAYPEVHDAPTRRLGQLARRFDLSALDVEFLLIALAPDLDSIFEHGYGYLNDDMTRRRGTVGLALELCGRSVLDRIGRARFGAGAPLLSGGLLLLEDADRPLPGRSLRVPDRVVGFLLGDDAPDGELIGLIEVIEPAYTSDADDAANASGAPGPAIRVVPDLPAGLVTALAAGPLLLQLRERRSGTADLRAVEVLHAAGRPALRIEVGRLPQERVEALAALAVREARLRDAGLVIDVSQGADPGPFCDPAVPVLLIGPGLPNAVHGRRPLVLDLDAEPDRLTLWRSALGDALAPGIDLADVTAPYRMTAARVRSAAATARALAGIDAGAVDAEHIHRAARLENGWSSGRGVRHIEPAVDWSDLVLPQEPAAQLTEFVNRVRHRDRVLGSWRLRRGGGRGRGVTALFAGESGTGKTLAAEVVARELGLDLYVVELSAMVDKYVGETEKNLQRLFDEADRVDSVLLFDEADSIFGKRSETKDAHDRYANLESSYLLQRLESFDGVAVLTTNLRSNIDEAFTRRFDLVVDFPFPDRELRRTLWEQCLSGPVPVAADVDLDQVAGPFELAGGSIRAAATSAAYLAAAEGGSISMEHVLTGARREYRKMGRLIDEF
jgi:ATPase family associated with various cellular activities (AAA)